MNTYIALLRGINVGGQNKLPMKRLVTLLERLDCQEVKTYIQSGNAVFQHGDDAPSRLAERIGEAIEAECGFTAAVLMLGREDFERAIAQNPFHKAVAEPKTLHLYFLSSLPTEPDFEKMELFKADSEQFELQENVFYPKVDKKRC